MRNGFTLVELSIVLVIVGLLIGGILVGQSLIASARVNRLVSDLVQYEAAINLFKSNYKSVPGDSGLFIPAGNQNNFFDNSVSGSCNGVYSSSETQQFWGHLSQSGMLNVDYKGTQPFSCGGANPTNALEGDTGPLTEVSRGGRNRQIISVAQRRNFPASVIRLRLVLMPLDAVALVSKLGFNNQPVASTTTGIIAKAGVRLGTPVTDSIGCSMESGGASGGGGAAVLCTDPRALYAPIYYGIK